MSLFIFAIIPCPKMGVRSPDPPYSQEYNFWLALCICVPYFWYSTYMSEFVRHCTNALSIFFPVFFQISGIRVGNAKGSWLKYLNWMLRLASRLRARRRGRAHVDTETHTAHTSLHTRCPSRTRCPPSSHTRCPLASAPHPCPAGAVSHLLRLLALLLGGLDRSLRFGCGRQRRRQLQGLRRRVGTW